MITISCTKKLFELSNFIEETNSISTSNEEFYSWHANVFRLERRNNIIFMNNETRYCFILFGIKKKDLQNIKELFTNALIENLRYENFEEKCIRKYVENIDQIKFTKTYNRSVLGSMSDMLRMMEFMIEEYSPLKEMTILQLNKELNHTPIVKLKSFPDQMMREALLVNKDCFD